MSAESNQKPYRLGVALSGGGAKGFAHVGALRALEEAGLRPDVIAGVSAGAVVAVLYSAGLSDREMLRMFQKAKFRDFCEIKFRGGLFKIDKFKSHLRKAIPGFRNIEDLPIPTYIGATDLDNGTAVEFHEGDIFERVAASCSVPILFNPTVIDGTRYVDGGVMHNVPTWILRDKCRCLIAVNCSPLPDNRPGRNSILEVGLRTYHLMLKGNVKDDMALCDIAVEIPEMAGYRTFDLKEINNVYLRGYTAARQALQKAGLWPSTNRRNLPEPENVQ